MTPYLPTLMLAAKIWFTAFILLGIGMFVAEGDAYFRSEHPRLYNVLGISLTVTLALAVPLVITCIWLV